MAAGKTYIATLTMGTAVLASLLAAGCGSGPPARDVQACHMAVTGLNKTPSASPIEYMAASAVAVTPDLKQDLNGISEGLGMLGAPGAMGSNSNDLANASIRAAGAICTRDGVSWPAGDS